MIVSQEIRDDVAFATAKLDKHFGNPNWRLKCEGFKFETLNDCIAGKLFGSFGKAMDVLGTCRGFDSSYEQTELDMYQQAWQDELDNPTQSPDYPE